MTPEEHDELWAALKTVSRLARDEELSRVAPGLEAVMEVVTEQVAEALGKLDREPQMTLRGRSMTVTRLGPDGKPTGPPSTFTSKDGAPIEVNVVSNPGLVVGERPTAAEVQARLRLTRKRRGIGT